MGIDLGLLLLTAASIGFIHTLLGPDHYLPFVAMSAARGWTRRRTMWVTALCGAGHVLGSVVIGMVGIGIGVSLSRLQWFESIRGDVAAWLLAGFGLAYMAWGLKKAWRSRPHTHEHVHADGTLHRHEHGHEDAHLHPHVDPARAKSITPWALFVIFVLGPCEPLIPLVMYPASKHSACGPRGRRRWHSAPSRSPPCSRSSRWRSRASSACRSNPRNAIRTRSPARRSACAAWASCSWAFEWQGRSRASSYST